VPNNFLVTGRPGSGKSTVIERTVRILTESGLSVGGLICPEIRDRSGARTGFLMRDIRTGEERVLASVGLAAGPSVGKYRVAVENVDFMADFSILRALREADVVVVDEIAPMEVFSRRFVGAVRLALDSPKPFLAAIHMKTSSGFIGGVKRRPDVRTWVVDADNREKLPREIASEILRVTGKWR